MTSYYTIWQLENFGNVLPSSTIQETEDEDRKMIEYFETQLLNHENNI